MAVFLPRAGSSSRDNIAITGDEREEPRKRGILQALEPEVPDPDIAEGIANLIFGRCEVCVFTSTSFRLPSSRR